ncbi:hypothetical protein Plhal304r1_c032g0103561 [Plasmopara halstedii]
MTMKPRGQPRNRPSLQRFVDENLSRDWTKLSDSPWVPTYLVYQRRIRRQK